MPIYNYRCIHCGEEVEIRMPMENRNDTQVHSCGAILQRLISLPQSAIIPIKNKDRLLHTLNRDNGFGFPDDKHTARYGKVIIDSLSREKSVIGRGF